jgi:hypothetical protein
MFYDPLSVSNEEENAQNILCINDHRQWASPMFTINVNQALRIKFEKLSDPDIAFPEMLHEKPHQINFQESAELDKYKIHRKTL